MPARNPKVSPGSARRLRALGERIRVRRKALQLSATVAAESARMSRVTWHRIEKGEPAVTMGAWVNAAAALGLDIELSASGNGSANTQELIPARIRLADYPQLEKLAWHVRNVDSLSAREAMDIYERNERHLDREAMTPDERSLLKSLRTAFGRSTIGVD